MRLITTLIVFTAACAPTSFEPAICTTEVPSTLALQDMTDLGHTPQWYYDQLASNASQAFVVTDGTLAGTFNGTLVATRSVVPETGIPERPVQQVYDADCTPYVVLPMQIEWAFADGGFQVQSFGQLNVYDAEGARSHLTLLEPSLLLDPDGLLGEALAAHNILLAEVEPYWDDPMDQGPLVLRDPEPNWEVLLSLAVDH